MECNLDRNKIKSGIEEAVINAVTHTGMFNIVGNSIVGKDLPNMDIPEVTPEQLALIDEALKYKDDIVGAYQSSFENSPADFLFEMAQQANSSDMEKTGAIKVAGERMIELALKVFPTVGAVSKEQKMIREINNSFSREVLTPTGHNQWEISVPDELVVKYLLGQPNSWSHVNDYLRARYLSQFTSTSLNLIGDDLWLNHPYLQDPTVKDMLAFMKKLNPSARVGEFEDLDQNAVSLIRDFVIMVKRGAMIDELPHEVSHFFFELLPDDHPLKTEMLSKIVDMPLYSKVYGKYSTNASYQLNGKPDISKIKREAVAQQIAEYVKAAYRNEADEKYGKKRGWLRDIIHNIFKFLRKLFHINSPAIYTEPLMDANSPFIQAANQIIQGDISNLNVKKVMSVYDSVFFDAVEQEIPETYEAGDIVKSMHEFTKAIKRQISKVFRVNVQDKQMQGLIDELNDPSNKDYNRIFDIVSRFGIAGDLLADIMSNPPTKEDEWLIPMVMVAQRMGEAYRSMETIPLAIESAIKKMEKVNDIDKLLDNVTELQAYATFAESFKTITKEFTSMLSYIKERWPSETEGMEIYSRMINNMGNVQTKFDVTNNEITSKLTTHLAKIMNKWTDSYLKDHREDLIARYKMAETDKIKDQLLQEIYGRFTDGAQFLRALTGNYGESKFEMIDGHKIDISHLKDVTAIDKIIYLTSSPTLVADPFLSNAVAYYFDKYSEYQLKGQMEAKSFADTVSPIMKELSDMGLGWYEANRLIQTTQSFYTPFSETKEVIKRTLLSPTNRFTFQFHKQQKWRAIADMQKELDKMKAFDSTSTEDEILEKSVEVDKAREVYNQWLAKVSFRPFTDKFYEKQALMKENKNDSPVLKKIKEIRSKLMILEQQQYVAFIIDETYQNSRYDEITENIARLQTQLIKLVDQLPPTDKDAYKLGNELYEVDEVRTSRLRQSHKNKMVIDIVDTLINGGKTAIFDAKGKQVGTKTRKQLEQEISDKYDALYTLHVPKQEFYDARSSIFDELKELQGNLIEFKGIQDAMDKLSEKERLYVKQIRDFRGDANMSSLRDIFVKDDNGIDVPFAKVLKEMELQIDMLRTRSRLYSQVLSSITNPVIKSQMIAFIDMMTGLTLVSENAIAYKATDVQRILSDHIDLTTSQAESILSAIQKATSGDNTELQSLANLSLKFTTKEAEAAFSMLVKKSLLSIEDLHNTEELMFHAFSEERRSGKSDELKEKMDILYQRLQDLYQNTVSFQYVVAMKDFTTISGTAGGYMQQYLEDDNYTTPNKQLHKERVRDLLQFDFALVSDIEKFFGDDLFEDVIRYMQMLERTEVNPKEGFPLASLIEYYLSIHKKKVYFSEGETITTWTPISYVRNPTVDPAYTEVRAPRFLTQSKVKREYVTERKNDVHPDVLSGKELPTVDMNGHWLPLYDENSEYWNKDYANLKNSTDSKDMKVFELLDTVTKAYLKKQDESLSDDDRLDMVLPSRYIDKFEQKKLLVTQTKDVWNIIRDGIPLLGGKKAEIEQQNYLEEIGQTAIKNPDIYTGLVISDQAIKLRSARTIPLERTSEDAISGVAMFFEDINEYSAKTIVEPIFKSFRDVLRQSNEKYPQSNKLRAEVFSDFYDLKILDKVPDNILNNKHVAKITQIVLTLSNMRLLMDIPGGLVNLTSGQLQMLIEVNFSKSAAANYAKSTVKATKWLKDFDYDFWRQSDWGLTTQMVGIFNMMPTASAVSHQLSLPALYWNIRSKMMAPRSEGEKLMAIQTGLAVVMSEPVPFEGEMIDVEDLYELDNKGIIKLKDEYQSLYDDWNPLNGKKVVMLRRKIMQFYTLLQGNYYDSNKPWLSSVAAGKWALAMKQWFASGFIRRMHGRVQDPFLQRPRVGHHFAMGSLIGNVAQAIWHKDPKIVQDYWNTIAKTPQEQLALRKSLAELMYTAIFGLLVLFAFGYDGDDKEKNKKLREMAYLKQLLLLVTMRVQGEIGTFIPLPMWGLGYMEMKRAIMDPIGLPKATVDNIMGLMKLSFLHVFSALGMNYEKDLYYQNKKGYSYNWGGLGAFKDKGDSKFLALLFNTVGYTGYTFEPAIYMQTFFQMQNRIK